MPEISNLSILAVFAAGIVSFLSPCVLPLVPGYLSYVTGQALNGAESREKRHGVLAPLWLSFTFVLGFSTVFVALGASATAVSQWLLGYRYEANIVGGAIVMLFGLSMTGLMKLGWMHRELRLHPDVGGGRPFPAYVLGVAFAFGWTPCIGPILGAILTVSAMPSGVSNGVVLLGVYSLGLGLPFLASAIFTDRIFSRLKPMRRTGRILQVGVGAVMMLMGVAMITGKLSELSYWLLDAFPGLARIG
jgi:cytochrome c-type biogenesis protein